MLKEGEKKAVGKTWWPSWLQCEVYSKSAIKVLEKENMPFWEKCRYKFHHFICYNCRRFLRQTKLLDRSILGLDDYYANPHSKGPCLSEEKYTQMQKEIDKQLA